jgi:hypothetical protein
MSNANRKPAPLTSLAPRQDGRVFNTRAFLLIAVLVMLYTVCW